MVYTLITDPDEIQACQRRLEDEMKKLGRYIRCPYSTRGCPEGATFDAYYLEDWDFFYRTGSRRKHRYGNAFGHGEPRTRLIEAFQLNVPKSGVDRRNKGGFLKSGSATCILHRGPLGGGRTDGSHNLCDYFRDLVDDFDDDGRDAEGIVIPFLDKSGKLEPDFCQTIKRIVDDLATRLGRSE